MKRARAIPSAGGNQFSPTCPSGPSGARFQQSKHFGHISVTFHPFAVKDNDRGSHGGGTTADKIGGQEVCRTFIEQTKLLVTLASAFVVAPAAVLAFSQLRFAWLIVFGEALFILSVLAGYVALGAVAGS